MEAFADGEILFRSLTYFHDYEDGDVTGDQNKGAAIFRPDSDLIINNLTKNKRITAQGWALKSTAKHEEIFVFCAR